MTTYIIDRPNSIQESLRSVSATEIETYLRCREEHRIAWVLRIRPRKQAETLRFGKAWGEGLDRWWSTTSLEAALLEFRRVAAVQKLDPYEVADGEVMLTGYDQMWGEEHRSGRIRTMNVEKRFSVLRPGPPPFRLVGLLDKIGVSGDDRFVGEHKHTGQDLQPGSPYWARLSMDTQISLYAIAARDMKINPDVCLYDVTRRPSTEPHRATPIEKRKYTKKTGELYANQHETDEPVPEYKERLIEVISKEPTAYFARKRIVRLEHEHERALRELDIIAHDLMRTKPDEPQPRTPGACMRYGRFCDFFAYCCGTESLDSERFVQIGARS